MTKTHLSGIGTMASRVHIQRDVDGTQDHRLGLVRLKVLVVDLLLAGRLQVIAQRVLGHAVGEGIREEWQSTPLYRLEELKTQITEPPLSQRDYNENKL